MTGETNPINIFTVYDPNIKSKVFMIRGDEAYARTTKTILSMNTFNDSDDEFIGYKVAFDVDVLRDMGTSHITIYDYDDVVGVFDWNDNTRNSAFGNYYLAYDNEHELRVRYHGNKQCLGSTSNVIPFQMDLPSKFNTIITFSNITYNGHTVDFDVSLSINGVTTYDALHNKSITISYVDINGDDASTTITTGDSSNTAHCTLTLGDGVNTVSASVSRSNINSASASQNMYVGYIVDLATVPTIVKTNMTYNVKVRVSDYTGAYVSGKSVTLYGASSSPVTATTDSNGFATYNGLTITDTIYATISGGYESEHYTPQFIDDVTISYPSSLKSYTLYDEPYRFPVDVYRSQGEKVKDTVTIKINDGVHPMETMSVLTSDLNNSHGYVNIPSRGAYGTDIHVSLEYGEATESLHYNEYLMYISRENDANPKDNGIINPDKFHKFVDGYYVLKDALPNSLLLFNLTDSNITDKVKCEFTLGSSGIYSFYPVDGIDLEGSTGIRGQFYKGDKVTLTYDKNSSYILSCDVTRVTGLSVGSLFSRQHGTLNRTPKGFAIKLEANSITFDELKLYNSVE